MVGDQDRCTAVGVGEDPADGAARPNLLFTPPCDCPRCAPDIRYEPRDDRRWLRISGDPQRYRVEELELGTVGRAVLG